MAALHPRSVAVSFAQMASAEVGLWLRNWKIDVLNGEWNVYTEGRIMRIVLGHLARGKGFRARLMSVVFASMSFAGTAMSEDQSPLARGEEIARSKCSACHAIGKSDPSPTRINVETSLRDLYLRFPITMLLKAVKTGYIDGHDEMPGFSLPPSEITALLLYIDSLSPEGAPRYIPKKR